MWQNPQNHKSRWGTGITGKTWLLFAFEVSSQHLSINLFAFVGDFIGGGGRGFVATQDWTFQCSPLVKHGATSFYQSVQSFKMHA